MGISGIDTLIFSAQLNRSALMAVDSQSLQKSSLHTSDEEKAAGHEPVNLSEDNTGEFTIPDGGWRAWSVVLGSTLALFVSFGYVRTILCFQQSDS